MRNFRQTENPARFRVGDRVICFRRGKWWWVEFYHERKQRRQPLKTTSAKEARRRAIQLEASLLDGTYRQAPPPKTIGEVIDLYKQRLETEARATSTIKRYGPELNRWLKFFERNGVTLISGISLILVERYRSQRKPKLAPTTLYHETNLLKQLLNFACDRGLIAANPLKKLKLRRPRPKPQPVYTLEQVNSIIADGGVYGSIYELLAFVGLRISEVRWLTWDDVDLDVTDRGGFIDVRAKPGEWRPKNGDDRKVPLHPRAAAVLARLPRRHRFVFTATASKRYPRGGHQINGRHVLDKLKGVLKRNGVAAGKVHTFRHFFISFCANNGVDPFKVMKWVGHSDIATVLRYYSLGDDESQRAMSAVPFGDGQVDGRDEGPEQGQNEHNSDARKAG